MVNLHVREEETNTSLLIHNYGVRHGRLEALGTHTTCVRATFTGSCALCKQALRLVTGDALTLPVSEFVPALFACVGCVVTNTQKRAMVYLRCMRKYWRATWDWPTADQTFAAHEMGRFELLMNRHLLIVNPAPESNDVPAGEVRIFLEDALNEGKLCYCQLVNSVHGVGWTTTKPMYFKRRSELRSLLGMPYRQKHGYSAEMPYKWFATDVIFCVSEAGIERDALGDYRVRLYECVNLANTSPRPARFEGRSFVFGRPTQSAEF